MSNFLFLFSHVIKKNMILTIKSFLKIILESVLKLTEGCFFKTSLHSCHKTLLYDNSCQIPTKYTGTSLCQFSSLPKVQNTRTCYPYIYECITEQIIIEQSLLVVFNIKV